MSWHHVHLIRPQILIFSQVEILSAFQDCYLKNHQPQKMWLLTDCPYAHAEFQHASELDFYFSPHTNCFCDKLIAFYDGRECAEPDFAKLYVAGGNHETFSSYVAEIQPA